MEAAVVVASGSCVAYHSMLPSILDTPHDQLICDDIYHAAAQTRIRASTRDVSLTLGLLHTGAGAGSGANLHNRFLKLNIVVEPVTYPMDRSS